MSPPSVPLVPSRGTDDSRVVMMNIEDYPISLDAHHMAEIFGKSLARIYALDAEGAFLFAENRPRIGKKSWSRDRVRAYFAGELTGLTVARKRGVSSDAARHRAKR